MNCGDVYVPMTPTELGKKYQRIYREILATFPGPILKSEYPTMHQLTMLYLERELKNGNNT